MTEKKKTRNAPAVAKMDRVIEWEGIATGEGQGWFGKSNGSNTI